MGRTHTISRVEAKTRTRRITARRVADVLLGAVALILVAPLMAVLALAVRLSSHGPIFHREPAIGPDGDRVTLLSFRTMLDGGSTDHHQRVRAVVGGEVPVTPVGRLLKATRLERLPRLLGLVTGRASIF